MDTSIPDRYVELIAKDPHEVDWELPHSGGVYVPYLLTDAMMSGPVRIVCNNSFPGSHFPGSHNG
jgi:hypothetical protein